MLLLICGACSPDYSVPASWLTSVIFAFCLSLRPRTRVVPDRFAASQPPICGHCRYELQGLASEGRCPECGASFDTNAPTRTTRVYTSRGFGCQTAAISLAYSCMWFYAYAAQFGYQVFRGWPAEAAEFQVWQRDVPGFPRSPAFWYDPTIWILFAAFIAIVAPFLPVRTRWAMLIGGTLAGIVGTAVALYIAWRAGWVLTPGWRSVQFYTALPIMAAGTLLGAFLARPRSPAAIPRTLPGHPRC